MRNKTTLFHFFSSFFFFGSFILFPLQIASLTSTDCLFVFFDAGETHALLPLLDKREKNGEDFRVLVMATAETVITPEKFPGKRLTLKDLNIYEQIDSKTTRNVTLSPASLEKLKELNPAVIIVGAASSIQKQILELNSHKITAVYLDSFNYDNCFENTTIMKQVVKVAQHVLCPSENIAQFLKKDFPDKPDFPIVGKPLIQEWQQRISAVDDEKIWQTLELKSAQSPLVSFIGGYGPGYDRINPLFEKCSQKLIARGFQVILQPHPKIGAQKVSTVELLAISDYVVGYNSSVIFDAALIGKNALFFVPKEIPYHHFAIEEGLIDQVEDCESLIHYIETKKKPQDIRKALHIPSNSTEVINSLIMEWIDKN